VIELQGKYGKATITIDNVESGVVSQVLSMINTEPFTNDACIMPDTHEGKGSVIGLTVKFNGKVCPNTIGVDIGCGMTAYRYNMGGMTLNDMDISWSVFDEQIRAAIPIGFNIHKSTMNLPVSIPRQAQRQLDTFIKNYNGTNFISNIYTSEDYFYNLCKKISADPAQVINSIGTLGGGNHFIEFDKDNNETLWSVVHSGSRNFGLKIANYHQRKAGKGDLAFLYGADAWEYLVDMFFAQQYASVNRMLISDILASIYALIKGRK
jgi:RNA-splicing ligase RtcB